MYYVYAISSLKRNYIYVGLTNNVQRRLSQHNSGKECTTKPYAPFELIYKDSFETRSQARQEEIKLKSGYGKEFLKTLK